MGQEVQIWHYSKQGFDNTPMSAHHMKLLHYLPNVGEQDWLVLHYLPIDLNSDVLNDDVHLLINLWTKMMMSISRLIYEQKKKEIERIQ